MKNPPEMSEEAIYYYVNYRIGNRTEIALAIKSACDLAGLQTLFGRVAGPNWDSTLEQMRYAKAILNISLLSELNQRNFQALVFNTPLLADHTGDHDRISGLDWSHTYYFKRDLSNFGEALEKALNDTRPVSSAASVLNGHMLTHRFIEIFNRELGLKLALDEIVP